MLALDEWGRLSRGSTPVGVMSWPYVNFISCQHWTLVTSEKVPGWDGTVRLIFVRLLMSIPKAKDMGLVKPQFAKGNCGSCVICCYPLLVVDLNIWHAHGVYYAPAR